MIDLEIEKARQLAQQIDADTTEKGRALGLALGKLTTVHTNPSGDLLAASTEILETS